MLVIYSCCIDIVFKLIYRLWLRKCVNFYELHNLYCSYNKMMANTLCVDLLLLMCVTNITDLKNVISYSKSTCCYIYFCKSTLTTDKIVSYKISTDL